MIAPQDFTSPHFPTGQELLDLLKLEGTGCLEEYFHQTLIQPLNDLFSRPSKGIRGQLVHLGFEVMRNRVSDPAACVQLQPECDRATLILETLHAGSLIVDDIQDGSSHRRGKESLHKIYGLPIALNLGNWLYFLPLTYIEALNISPDCRSRLMKRYNHTLFLAHYGQAIDVGVEISSVAQERVHDLAMASMDLKSGVLTGYALQVGAIIAGATDSQCERLDYWGRRLGKSLQMFDDIGNLKAPHDSSKKLEDLKLKKPGYILAVASTQLSGEDYQRFIEVLMGGNENELESFVSKHRLLSQSFQNAKAYLTSTVEGFIQEFDIQPRAQNELIELQEKLVASYV